MLRTVVAQCEVVILVAALTFALSTAALAQDGRFDWQGPKLRQPLFGQAAREPPKGFILGRHSYINSLGEWIPSIEDDPWHLPGHQ